MLSKKKKREVIDQYFYHIHKYIIVAVLFSPNKKLLNVGTKHTSHMTLVLIAMRCTFYVPNNQPACVLWGFVNHEEQVITYN